VNLRVPTHHSSRAFSAEGATRETQGQGHGSRAAIVVITVAVRTRVILRVGIVNCRWARYSSAERCNPDLTQ
jgi:hypothetical protein